jgi:hypothetical protein
MDAEEENSDTDEPIVSRFEQRHARLAQLQQQRERVSGKAKESRLGLRAGANDDGTKRRKLRHVNPGTTVQSTTVRATGDVAGIMMTGRGDHKGLHHGLHHGRRRPTTIVRRDEKGSGRFASAGRFAAIVGQLRPATGHHDRRAGLQLTAGDAGGASARPGRCPTQQLPVLYRS